MEGIKYEQFPGSINAVGSTAAEGVLNLIGAVTMLGAVEAPATPYNRVARPIAVEVPELVIPTQYVHPALSGLSHTAIERALELSV